MLLGAGPVVVVGLGLLLAERLLAPGALRVARWGQPAGAVLAIEPHEASGAIERAVLRADAAPDGGVAVGGVAEQHALGERKSTAGLGPQERRIGETRLFVVPNPSPANAHVRPADQVDWYDRLADFVAEAAGDSA